MATYTGSITLTNINDGVDADSYHLSSNIEGFQKHYEYDQNGNEVVIFSDDVIEFQLEHSVNEQSQPVSPSSYYTSLLTLESGAFYSEYNYTTAEAWQVDYATVYIKVGSEYILNTDSQYNSTQTYYVNLLNGINDLWVLFQHINVVDENNDSVTLYDKVYSIDEQNNSINFNLYNSVFYPVDESLNLVDEQPSKYIVALKNYRDFVEQQNAYFILKAFEDENLTQLYDYKVFFVEYVVNLNFARFALTATNIQASVDNSTMIFDGEGLTIYDGGLTIKQSQQYAETEDTIPQQSKIYFIYNNGHYEQIDPGASFDPEITYYELISEEDLLKYDNDNKRLIIKGSGEFTGTIYATDGVFSGTVAATAGSIGGFDIGVNALTSKAIETVIDYTQWNYDASQWSEIYNTLYIFNTTDNDFELNTNETYDSNTIYYLQIETPSPLIQLLGSEGRIIAKNIDLGTGVNITDYIKLGNSYIYNPLTHDNSFIDIKDVNNESIIEFRADGTGNIGAIHINGNTSRLNGINWWISPDKAEFSNIDVTGTIHTSVFETGRIQSVGGSMIFKEGARVQSVTNTEEGLLLTLETKMGLKPGSIVLCTTNDSDYTDTTLINQLNFYGRVISSIIEREYVENTDPFYENVAYYTYDTQSGKYIRFTGDSFEGGVTYYILHEGNQQVVVELETEAAGYENLISQIIQLGDNTYIETEDLSPQPDKLYYEYNMITDSFILHTGNFETGHIYYERTDEYTNNLIIGVNATSHINKMLYPEGFTFIKFDNLGDDTINPTFNNTPILFLGNLDGLNDENITGYGLYGENVFLTGSLTTRYSTEENFKYAGVNTLSGAIATIFEDGNYFPGEQLPENDKIIFWAGSNSTAAEDVQTSPFQVTENGYFYASHGVFEGSIFVRATIEASELRTASIYGTGNAPALKIYDTNLNKLGIHFYEIQGNNEYETLRLTSAGFSNDQGVSYFINIDGNQVNFNGNNITGNVFYTIPVNNSQLEIIGTNFNVYQYNQEGSANIFSFINFNPDNQYYEIKYDEANRILQDKQNGELVLFSGSTKISTNFSLGGKIDYKQAVTEREEGNQTISELIGYDLFVR